MLFTVSISSLPFIELSLFILHIPVQKSLPQGSSPDLPVRWEPSRAQHTYLTVFSFTALTAGVPATLGCSLSVLPTLSGSSPRAGRTANTWDSGRHGVGAQRIFAEWRWCRGIGLKLLCCPETHLSLNFPLPAFPPSPHG